MAAETAFAGGDAYIHQSQVYISEIWAGAVLTVTRLSPIIFEDTITSSRTGRIALRTLILFF